LLTISCGLAYADEVKIIRRAVWLIFLAAFVNAGAWDASEPLSLLTAAFKKMDQLKETRTRFTFLDLHHNVNFNEKGKKTVDETELYDVIYIGDLQYSRLLEVEGKPLKGKQLAEEQQRYDAAVREHSALDDAARAKIQRETMKSLCSNLNLSELTAKYKNTIADHGISKDCECVIVNSVPLSGAPQRSYRFWIDSVKQEMIKIESTLLADEDDKLKGSTITLQYTYLDGIPLVSHSHIDANLTMGKKQVHVVTDHTYSNFRKFSVTSTIVPVESEGKP
jgi:hypothetical protein